MIDLERRRFVALAASLAASAAWAGTRPQRSPRVCRERRDLYPEGVASGDPDAHSVLLWTRYPRSQRTQAPLRVEVAEDDQFHRVIVVADTRALAASDWTCRVLVGNLKPARVYWYRFIDQDGHASRVGRTSTAPADDDPRPVRFAFVSCQNTNLGAQNAYRRMIFEDERAAEDERLGFVLHLGDFLYEVMWYPEEHPQGLYGRRVREVVRYAHGEKVGDLHVPRTVDDYRSVYRAYLHDADIQDARARWPFVCMWDNHEFTRAGWQSLEVRSGKSRPAQALKVAANQAWFEYLPARVRKASGPSLERFDPPGVVNAPIEAFDDQGLGREANNLAAIGSLTTYRALRWGRHVELILTDQRSYRSERPAGREEARALWSPHFPRCIPQEALEILDAGRVYGQGRPPETIRVGDVEIPNFRKEEPPQTILGAEQKAWFLKRLRASETTWKIWGSSTGTLDRRIDLQNLPSGTTVPWPGAGYAVHEDGDHSSAYVERAEIYDLVRREKITGFATVCGDRHGFWAGLAAPTLPPRAFEPVGVAFVTASISMPNAADLLADALPPKHPLRPLFLLQRQTGTEPEPVANLLLQHGVRSSLEYGRTGDADRVRALSNPDLSPHLTFLDLASHGFATVRAAGNVLECEFVCLPRPLESAARPDGGNVVYRVKHRVPLWREGEAPQLQRQVVEDSS